MAQSSNRADRTPGNPGTARGRRAKRGGEGLGGNTAPDGSSNLPCASSCFGVGENPFPWVDGELIAAAPVAVPTQFERLLRALLVQEFKVPRKIKAKP